MIIRIFCLASALLAGTPALAATTPCELAKALADAQAQIAAARPESEDLATVAEMARAGAETVCAQTH